MVRPIYTAIMAAAERGVGIHLSANEVRELSQDDAIVTRAGVECEDDEAPFTDPNFCWRAQLGYWLRMRKDNPHD